MSFLLEPVGLSPGLLKLLLLAVRQSVDTALPPEELHVRAGRRGRVQENDTKARAAKKPEKELVDENPPRHFVRDLVGGQAKYKISSIEVYNKKIYVR